MKPVALHEMLGENFFARVTAAQFNSLTKRYRNQDAAKDVSLDTLSDEQWQSYFGAFTPFPDSFKTPLALCYHGHQFGIYNPEIGDGRGFLYAQLREDTTNRLLDLGTKGSGTTPFSRSGDGRLTLKGAVREILASEYLNALSVNSCKILSVFETEEQLHRNDEPSPTRAAVLVRLSHSHIRIGSFQRLAYLNQPQEILTLARYVARYYYPDIDPESPPEALLLALLEALIICVAEMVAGWMAAGFVHGVLNTDNFNLTGESFDYGPWRFLDKMDFNFTAAYFDREGRYAYGKQPEAALWALCRLADCFTDFVSTEPLEKILQKFYPAIQSALSAKLCWRFGVAPVSGAKEADFVSLFFSTTTNSKINLDYLFHHFYAGFEANQILSAPEPLRPLLGVLKELPARQNERPYYFDDPLESSLVFGETERLWAAISDSDDWSQFEKKIKAIKRYSAALKA
ncbi:MAG: YdiU family protein [Alphaproteobacteria bacterium]